MQTGKWANQILFNIWYTFDGIYVKVKWVYIANVCCLIQPANPDNHKNVKA